MPGVFLVERFFAQQFSFSGCELSLDVRKKALTPFSGSIQIEGSNQECYRGLARIDHYFGLKLGAGNGAHRATLPLSVENTRTLRTLDLDALDLVTRHFAGLSKELIPNSLRQRLAVGIHQAVDHRTLRYYPGKL
jgi:hypothetical protein